jgi:hypothetical protein
MSGAQAGERRRARQDFEAFRDQRMLPAIQAVLSEKGIEPQGPPSYEFSEIHHVVKG